MHDLVGAYERMRQVYQWYIESAFPLRYGALSNERQRSSVPAGNLVSTTTARDNSSLSIIRLQSDRRQANYYPPNIRTFNILLKRCSHPTCQLWPHQLQCLQEVLINKRDIIVTTGTGSGKTECFLLPLLAELARESASWPSCPPSPEVWKWWEKDGVPWNSQWSHTGRKSEGLHAVRAIVLYPLNALVEDQLRPLTKFT